MAGIKNETIARWDIAVALDVTEETAIKCLMMLQWFLDDHPDYSLHEIEETIDGKLKHKLWLYNKNDDWKMGGKQ